MGPKQRIKWGQKSVSFSGRDIETYLRDRARGEEQPRELIFDPKTGELQLARREPTDVERDDDRVVIDQITEEGFFAD